MRADLAVHLIEKVLKLNPHAEIEIELEGDALPVDVIKEYKTVTSNGRIVSNVLLTIKN